jgi:hypothetical protein
MTFSFSLKISVIMDFDLNDDEREMFDEINILASDEPRRFAKPPPSRQFKKQVSFNEGLVEEPIDMFANSSKMNLSQPPPPVEWDGGDGAPPMENMQRSIPTGPSEGYKSVEDEKADLLNRIARLGKKGLNTSSRLTVYSDIEDIRAEYKRLTYSIEVDQSIRFQRRMLVACVSGVEFLNKKFDPFDLELDGWSENVMENQEDYDSVFEELFQKYRSKVSVAPEIKMMFMIGGSAMMFHLSKSMFKPFQQQAASQQQQQQAASQQQQQQQRDRREMKGPGIDLASLGKGLDISSILGTLQQQPIQQMMMMGGGGGGGGGSMNGSGGGDDISDIISIGSDIRDFEISTPSTHGRKKRGRGSSSNKKELVL